MTGKVIGKVELPVSNITCASLGGPEYNWLFITSANKDDEPESGSLYVAKVETPGLPENRFND